MSVYSSQPHSGGMRCDEPPLAGADVRPICSACYDRGVPHSVGRVYWRSLRYWYQRAALRSPSTIIPSYQSLWSRGTDQKSVLQEISTCDCSHASRRVSHLMVASSAMHLSNIL